MEVNLFSYIEEMSKLFAAFSFLLFVEVASQFFFSLVLLMSSHDDYFSSENLRAPFYLPLYSLCR